MAQKTVKRTPGRPKKEPDERAVRFAISLAADNFAMLEELAGKGGRSSVIADLIEKAYRRKR